jgi:hypothetical protein
VKQLCAAPTVSLHARSITHVPVRVVEILRSTGYREGLRRLVCHRSSQLVRVVSPTAVISGGGHLVSGLGHRPRQHEHASTARQRTRQVLRFRSARSFSILSLAHTPNRCCRFKAGPMSSGLTIAAASRLGGSSTAVITPGAVLS